MTLSEQQFTGEQLKLFMSAREIKERFAVHEGDRQYHGKPVYVAMQPGLGQYGDHDPRAGLPTRRSHRTDGASNDVAGPGLYYRSTARLREPIRPETDEEMWDRKAREAGVTEEGNAAPGSLAESLVTEGVQHPVPLTTHQRSRFSRPMVGGGQHRIAAMAELRPDALMPVVYHEDIVAAQNKTRPNRPPDLFPYS